MSTKRRKYGAAFKRKVVLEALREDRTINEIASAYGLHPTQISVWKKQAIDGLEALFADRRRKDHRREEEAREARLMEKIGQLPVELDWLKKKQACDDRKQLIEPHHSELSIVRQCELLGLSRSSFYYHPAQESEENLFVMRRLDELYTAHPYYEADEGDSCKRGLSSESQADPETNEEDGFRGDLSETQHKPE